MCRLAGGFGVAGGEGGRCRLRGSKHGNAAAEELRGLPLAGPRRSGSTMPVMGFCRGGIFCRPGLCDCAPVARGSPGIARSLADDEGAEKYTDSVTRHICRVCGGPA